MKSRAIRPPRYVPVLTALALFVTIVFRIGIAEARPDGIDSSRFTPVLTDGCNNCHKTQPPTALAPSVSLSASSTSITTADQITLTIVVTSNNPTVQIAGGFNVRSSQRGTFAVGGPASVGTRTIANLSTQWLEATHSTPKANDGSNQATFTTLWTPMPAVTGTVTFTAWGNSVNLLNGNIGDRAAMATPLAITVCTASTWYRDADGDTYGNPAMPTSACTQPAGYVANNTDCNDAAATVHPGAAEVCNGVDDNCAGGIDEGVTTTYYRDADGDGYGTAATTVAACSPPAGYVANNTDCNDGAVGINPAAAEICNGIDDNCAGGIDEGLTPLTFYRDADGDGYGAAAMTKSACSLAVAGAGYVANSTDCDDTNVNVSPAAPEICGNGKDDNCNGVTDTDAPATSTFYKDTDGDGYGSAASGTATACAPPTGFVSSNTDCNDAVAAIHPGATEVCNGQDDNCAGGIDEGLVPLTCGDGACLTTVAACVGGVPQTCVPVCPEAGIDAAPDAVAPDSAIVPSDAARPDGTLVPDVATSNDATRDASDTDAPIAIEDGGLPDVPQVVADAVSAIDSGARPPDARADAMPGGARDDAPTGASEDDGAPTDSGCSCRIGAPLRVSSSMALAAGLALLVLARRRRRG